MNKEQLIKSYEKVFKKATKELVSYLNNDYQFSESNFIQVKEVFFTSGAFLSDNIPDKEIIC